MTSKTKKILMVLTSHSQLGDSGRDTGYYVPEVSHPYDVFTAKGFEIDFASPLGGKPPVDGYDPKDPSQKAFMENVALQKKLNNSLKPSEVNADDYDAIFFVGGMGTVWDFPENKVLADIAKRIYEKKGVVSAVCHGPSALLNIKLSDGSYLIAGKKLAGFSNEEEDANGTSKFMPFFLEDALKDRGAIYVETEKWTPNIQTDGRLVTGQNPQSAHGVAESVASLLAN